MEMKNWFILFFLLGVLAFPWSCGNSPTSPASTPTFTPTPTNWAGYTSTITATPTMTATATATNLNGNTSTPTLTPTTGPNTNTPTFTNIPTSTNTATYTIPPTNTITPWPTSTPAVSVTPLPNVIAQWTPSGIKYPNGVAYNSNSQLIYVAEGGDTVSQVQVLNTSGVVQGTITQYGTVNFTEPYGVAFNSGTTFVLDGGSPGAVYAFSAATTAGAVTIAGAGSLSGPEGIAVDSTGVTVFVSDALNNQIDVYTYSGTSFTAVTSWTSGVGAFNTPSGLVIDSNNNLYVADSGNEQIQMLNGSSSTWSIFASTDIFSDGYSNVFGLGVDSSNNIYACDAGNSMVDQFASNGALLTYWAGGTGAETFSSPDGIAFLSNGQIVVSDWNNNGSATNNYSYGSGSLLVFNP